MLIQVHGCVWVCAQYRRWSQRADLSFKARFDRFRFSSIRDDANNLFRFQNLAHAHGNGSARYVVQSWELSFPELLTPASFIQRNNQIFFLGFKIGGRIVEGEMPVLSDSNKSDIDGGSMQCLAGATNYFGWISLTVEQMVMSDSGFSNQTLLKIIGEAGRMRRR